MVEIAARDLRNRTTEVLRMVEEGQAVTITSRGHRVAALTPVPGARRRPIVRAELAARLGRAQADPKLRDDLALLAGAPPVISVRFDEVSVKRTARYHGCAKAVDLTTLRV